MAVPATDEEQPASRTEEGTTRRGEGPAGIAWYALAVVAGVMALAIAFAPLAREAVGLLVLALVIVLLAMGFPIAIAMLAASAIGLWRLGGTTALSSTLQSNIFDAVATWQLSVIPLFILMGVALWRAGLTTKAYASARLWLGKLPGGLAVGTNFAGAGLAAASGSTLGISYALGRIAVPEMMRTKYQPGLATASVTMAGTLGQLIPPSVMLVIYAGIAETPVGPQLMAGAVPGVLLAVCFGVMIIVRASLKPSLAPRIDMTGVTWGARFKSLTGVAPVVVVVLIVIGGLLGGVFTPTESGAFGAIAAILLGWLASDQRKKTGARGFYAMVRDSVRETVVSAAMIFLLLICVHVLIRVMTLSQVTQGLAGWVVDLGLDRISFLLVLIVLFVILGMFMDPLSMMLLTIPVLTPVLLVLNVDMLWFGVFIVILAEVAIVTPPIGVLVFIMHRLVQDEQVSLGTKIPVTAVFKAVLWFVAVVIAVLILLIFVPDLVTWLPGQMA